MYFKMLKVDKIYYFLSIFPQNQEKKALWGQKKHKKKQVVKKKKAQKSTRAF